MKYHVLVTHAHTHTHKLQCRIWLKDHSDEKTFYWCHWPLFPALQEHSFLIFLYLITMN